MKEKEPIFPPELSHFEQQLEDAEAKIAEIDKNIEELPSDRGWRLELRPPGFSNLNQPGTRQYLTFQYEQQKNLIRSEFYHTLENESHRVDKDTLDSIKLKVQDKFEKPYNKDDKTKDEANKDQTGQYEHFSEKQEQFGRDILNVRYDFNAKDITEPQDDFNTPEPSAPDFDMDKD